jgi:glycosyltransferase involved in cell wall biosynthesis
MQARIGISVAFIAAEGSFRKLLEDQGVEVHALPLTSRRQFFSSLLRVRDLVREFNPDIVHAHMVPGAILGRLLQSGSRYKLITSVHNSGRAATRLMSIGDVAICVSGYLAGEMRKRGMPSEKIRVVRNGPLGSPRSVLSAPINFELKHPAIVTVAQPASHKGVGDLIAAFSQLNPRGPKPYLYIVGDGIGRSKFERQAMAGPGADRIVFCGFITDPAAVLRNADIFVLVSHREGFGLVLAEAREAGCAIVASDVGGIPEVLDGGAAGLLVAARSPQRLAAALTQLIEDPLARNSWGAKASSNLEWLSSVRMARETVAVYEEILGVAPGTVPSSNDALS